MIVCACSEWLEQDDPRYVGAWWLGFLAAFAGMLLFAVPMSGFPKDLPGGLPRACNIKLPSKVLHKTYIHFYVHCIQDF